MHIARNMLLYTSRYNHDRDKDGKYMPAKHVDYEST
jgi:hypothetical protein